MSSDRSIALVAWSTSLSTLLVGGLLVYNGLTERQMLHAARTAQEQPLHQTQQAREQLTKLALAVAKLAEGGNAGAKQIVDGMKREGITVKP